MDLTYVVNRASVHPRVVDVPFKGEVAKMTMAELEVELVDPSGVHGTLCLHFSGTTEMEDAKRFVEGSAVTLSLAALKVVAPTVEMSADPVA